MRRVLDNFLQSIKQNKLEAFLLLLIILIASFLRFYKITELHFFTYDQARDAIYVKRMVVDHIPRLLGTQTSLPGMYLPPFYYYTIAPILWLFKLNPVGIDIYSALVGVLSVLLVYFVANQVFGRPAGIFSAGLFAVSPLVVELTRRAWNPNTLPFFILLAFYFLWRWFDQKKTKDLLLAFGVYGYCLSLHFGAWTLLPLFAFSWFCSWRHEKRKRILVAAVLILFFFISPLIMFELRHQFFLTSQAKIFFFDQEHLGLPLAGLLESILTSTIAIFTILFSGRIFSGLAAPLEFSRKMTGLFRFSQPISVVAQKPFSLSFQWWGLVMFGLIVATSIWYLYQGKKKTWKFSLALLWAWVLTGVIIAQFYVGKFFFFYYLFLFPVPFLLLGFLAKFFWTWPVLRWLVVLVTLAVFVFHLRHTTVFQPEWRDINDLHNVARMIAQDAPEGANFNIAAARREADRWDRNAVDYQYFVETFYDRRPLDWLPEDYRQAEVLYLVSELGPIDALSSPIMEVQEFSPGQIEKTWQLPKEIYIYKMTK